LIGSVARFAWQASHSSLPDVESAFASPTKRQDKIAINIAMTRLTLCAVLMDCAPHSTRASYRTLPSWQARRIALTLAECEDILPTTSLTQQFRQLRNVARYAPSLIHRGDVRYVRISLCLAAIDIGERLPVSVQHFVAAGNLLDR